jgi:hypothetical protein
MDETDDPAVVAAVRPLPVGVRGHEGAARHQP